VENISLLLFIIALALGGGFGYWLNQKLKPLKEEKLNREVRDKNQKMLQDVATLSTERSFLQDSVDRLSEKIEKERSSLEDTILQEKRILKEAIETEKISAEQAFSNYVESLEFSMCETEEQYDNQILELQIQLDKMKSARLAGIEASLREQEIREKADFYKICILQCDLADIQLLESIKPRLRRPDVLSKLIWTTYYQKSTTSMCNNVIGADICSGIYKITDLITGLAYIGQSVNIAQRWKDHVKSALGAGTTTATNKLYSAMQKSGVHNFTFEVLEKAPKESLNERELYWINFYESKKFGLNTVKGNS
jgi:hypothetical protein